MSIFDWLHLLDSLNEEDKRNLETFCQSRELWAWDILFEEWDDANAMYFLKTWAIQIYKNIDWKIVNLGQVKAEEILWEMALFWWWEGKRMATAEAIKDSVLITILSFSIKEITEKYPDLMKKIQTVIEERNMNNKILENSIKK